ncbi:hypothetical protein Cni_G13748 [Canna indica]|uniref:TPX2 C-terminal domain-containing protein n=1 Tax=Canna indica TaxID=4628 RepID=A0AAQ3QE14_9LILI|nr:hypothetical protein Cni_G13748 [Canna indica]
MTWYAFLLNGAGCQKTGDVVESTTTTIICFLLLSTEPTFCASLKTPFDNFATASSSFYTRDEPLSRLMSKAVVKMATEKKSESSASCAPKSNSDRVSKPASVVESKKAKNFIQGDESSHQGQEVPYLRNISSDQEKAANKHDPQKLFNQEKSIASKFTNSRNARPNHTVPRPFSLETEKRASAGNHPCVAEMIGSADKLPRAYDFQWANILRKTQSNSAFPFRKPIDSCSVASSTATSVRISKGTTVATAPTFRCSDRAQKRKEFYSMLGQKHQALEEEKTQFEARMREEQEAALKEFRRSLIFKANPMPGFYHEGPPPKVELKKIPPTRAKSPKFTRRKICSDANPAEGDKSNGLCSRSHRHNLDAIVEAAKGLQSSPKYVKSNGVQLNRVISNLKPLSTGATMQATNRVSIQT